MEFFHLVRERYSVRSFSAEPVAEAALETILDAARVAPTAHNDQPQRLLVLRVPESLEKLKQCTRFTFNAPLAIIVCCDHAAAWVRPHDQYDSGVIDAAIVGTHIMLAAHDLGLGSTWVGHFDPAAVRAAFNLPESYEPVAIFPIGHPSAESRPAHLHGKRRSLDEIVRYETF